MTLRVDELLHKGLIFVSDKNTDTISTEPRVRGFSARNDTSMRKF